uniref:Phosducin domain-containing protein n=1 Tax=Helobdella robusta TaxID=6412 RepID=T1G6U5_HELRO
MLDELEDDDLNIPAHIREARMAEFKKATERLNEMKQSQHGDYNEILEEKQFLDTTIAEERCIVHFFHPDFRRCAIMDGHLKNLAQKHFESRFIKINAEKAKFFVTKLKVYVLPTVLCFKKGVVVDRLIGFDDLGNTDDFTTGVLENHLSKSGC